MRRPGFLVAAVLVLAGCNWITTARNALRYPTVARGEVENLVTVDSVIFATLSEDGFAILDATSLKRLRTVPPPPGTESVDAVAVAGRLLFALDAKPPGHLSVYSLEDVYNPGLLGEPRVVPVGPFSGVSANGALCIVSGGTSQLTAWRFNGSGLTDSVPFLRADLGRGQPNALVAKDGERAFVATHYYGPQFGLEEIGVGHDTVERLGSFALAGAGFTDGGAKPASFPIALGELERGRVLAAYGRSLSAFRTDGSLQLEWTIELPGPVTGLAVRGSRAMTSIAGDLPMLVEVSTEGTPRILHRSPLPPGTKPLGVAFTPTSAAVAARERGVLGFK